MLDSLTQWATLLSPIISVIAIIVALRVARSSSKDAQEQIKAIRHLLDMFIAANRGCKICRRNCSSPFIGGPLIEQIRKMFEAKEYLNHLLAKHKEIEVNLSLIQDYIKKATR